MVLESMKISPFDTMSPVGSRSSVGCRSAGGAFLVRGICEKEKVEGFEPNRLCALQDSAVIIDSFALYHHGPCVRGSHLLQDLDSVAAVV